MSAPRANPLMLTYRMGRRATDTRRAAAAHEVLIKLFAEMVHERLNRIRRDHSQPADRCGRQRTGEVANHSKRASGRRSRDNLVEQVNQLLRAEPARNALATRLV